jgi:hypothetical protein
MMAPLVGQSKCIHEAFENAFVVPMDWVSGLRTAGPSALGSGIQKGRMRLMRRFITLGLVQGLELAAILTTGTRPVMAQAPAASKADVFGGVSFVRRTNTFSGWNASVTGNMRSWLGVTADFAGNYNSGVHLQTYTFGPRLSLAQDSSLVPFTQATFGVARLSASGVPSLSGFGAYIGGGMDWYATDHIGIRLIQLDAQLTRISGSNSTGTRISFGVVFKLGS